jgi:hypothetical protein
LYQKLFKIVGINIIPYINRGINMKVVLCIGDVCIPEKCPVVDVQDDKVIIGEKENICTLTREQFDILKEKIKNGEI